MMYLRLFVPALVTLLELLGKPMKQNLSDTVIDEIREVRHRISARFGHDPTQLVLYYVEMQKQYKDRLIKTAKNSEDGDQAIT